MSDAWDTMSHPQTSNLMLQTEIFERKSEACLKTDLNHALISFEYTCFNLLCSRHDKNVPE